MKNTFRTIGLMVTTLFLSACAMHGKTLYSVEKIWADKTYLYVFYEKKINVAAGTLLNVHGGVDFSNKHYYYKKIERRTLAENFEINLADGIDAGNLKYVDEDFRLEDGGALHPEKRYVTNRSGRIEVLCDKNELVTADIAVSRVDDRLFYCGNVISVTGGEPRKLPGNIAEKLKTLSGRIDPGYTPTQEFSHSGRGGIVLVRIREEAQYLELDAVSFEIKGEGSFPVGHHYFRGSGEYSERGFVFDNYEEGNPDIRVCDSRGCRKLSEPDNYRSLFVDAENKVYALVSPEGKGYFWSPILKVRLLDVEGKTGAASQ